ncbi:copper chaperone PCu(A)C [Mesorhizobium amorphae]|jgi:copper(I)-binding protein|uniref:copper chaperone PCu(A)C n=1 Tax=Mesorhizobium amorphae TaxID=71433 RepID=UPI00118531DB|nr:copper chaperone PCu(A)C [Mesorhizobium amorphae]
MPVFNSTLSPAFSLRSSIPARLGLVSAAFAVLLAGMPAAFAHEFKVGSLEIDHPWSRATPPGAKVAGGYLTIKNSGGEADRLVSIASDVSQKAEVHEMAVKDGVMTMRKVDGGLEVPANGKAELAPGGYHLMFIGLNRQPKQGEKFAATLTFEKAGPVTVEFDVEAVGGAAPKAHGDHAN